MDHRGALLRLALPNYAALLSGVVAGIIDVAWVAGPGRDAVAAVAVATNVENLLLGIALLVTGGTTVTLAGRLGAGDRHGAAATVRAGWLLHGIIAPVVALAGWASRAPLSGGSSTMRPFAAVGQLTAVLLLAPLRPSMSAADVSIVDAANATAQRHCGRFAELDGYPVAASG